MEWFDNIHQIMPSQTSYQMETLEAESTLNLYQNLEELNREPGIAINLIPDDTRVKTGIG